MFNTFIKKIKTFLNIVASFFNNMLGKDATMFNRTVMVLVVINTTYLYLSLGPVIAAIYLVSHITFCVLGYAIGSQQVEPSAA